MWKLLPLLLFAASCAVGGGSFQSRYSGDVDQRNIRRVAVLPPEAPPAPAKVRPLYGAPPEPVVRPVEEEAAVALSHHIHSTMAGFPRWQMVSEREVREAASVTPAGSVQARARQLGEFVHADAIVSGRVLRYRERVGEEWGVKSPASVSFVIEVWDVKRGDIVWSGRYDETQRPLSENIFAVREFSQRGARWLKADELALDGVKKAIADLHQILYRGVT
jgi:TolB-like protein